MKKRGKLTTLIFILILIAGVSLIAYPNFSSYWNSLVQSRAVAEYHEAASRLSDEECEALLKAAREYNVSISRRTFPYTLSEQQQEEYWNLLNVGNDGVIGYLDVPAARVTLPIYHGTEEEVLRRGAGHLEWSSLPVGGESTHASLSSHRGLPSATLFTHMDLVSEGDEFTIQVLNETLTYEVDQILTVVPEDIEPLYIIPGEDHVTLITCTPYGVNTHRLLVRGKRVPTVYKPGEVRVLSEAIQINTFIVAVILAVPLLIIAFIIMNLIDRRKQKKNERIERLLGLNKEKPETEEQSKKQRKEKKKNRQKDKEKNRKKDKEKIRKKEKKNNIKKEEPGPETEVVAGAEK